MGHSSSTRLCVNGDGVFIGFGSNKFTQIKEDVTGGRVLGFIRK
jgi:hypothetical protein